MRSRAHFRSHPIHAMLIPFPFAFLLGGFAADLGGEVFGAQDLHVAAWYLFAAGVVMGVVAAVPGFIDYLATVPPDSTGKKRATRHMTVNSSALLLFAAAWWLRGGPDVTPEPVLLLLEAGGAVLLSFGGWMGGTLVFRNQIGVDHRYAGAGKWKEQRVDPAAASAVVASHDELGVNQMKLLRVGDRRIVLARTGDGYVAFSDHCTHRGGSLAGGIIACGTVTCPWHGSQFDVKTGSVCAGPAESPIDIYPVETAGGEVRLMLRQ